MNKINRWLSAILVTVMAMSLVACGNKTEVVEVPEIELQASVESIMGEFGATLLAGQSADVQYLEADQIEELYGITPDMYVQVEARIPISEEFCDEYIFIQATEGNIDNITDAFKSRVKELEASTDPADAEILAYIGNYQLYARGDFAAFGVGMSAENAIEFFKTKFVE